MTVLPFVIERVYNASPEAVWSAITDKNKMKEWYFDLAEFKAEPGFEFEFTAGDDKKKYLHRCKVIEVIPIRKLSYTWSYEIVPGESLVSFELFPEEDRTRLRLTHSGLETFKTDNTDFKPESFEKGWSHIIGKSLKEYVERRM
ncbi:MAG: SRPBCC domain-containing protein [Chitinophagaceae bacterium]|nr:SRPBCC domain-containing protein [Chitinophagaceae bacterium]